MAKKTAKKVIKKVQSRVKEIQVRKIPTGLKAISVLYFICAAMVLLFGIIFIIGGLTSDNTGLSLFSEISDTGFVVLGAAIYIGIGVLAFFIARGLWKAQQWARIAAIFFAFIGMISALAGILAWKDYSGLVLLLIHALIGGYLLFSKEVKAAFA